MGTVINNRHKLVSTFISHFVMLSSAMNFYQLTKISDNSQLTFQCCFYLDILLLVHGIDRATLKIRIFELRHIDIKNKQIFFLLKFNALHAILKLKCRQLSGCQKPKKHAHLF